MPLVASQPPLLYQVLSLINFKYESYYETNSVTKLDKKFIKKHTYIFIYTCASFVDKIGKHT